MTGSLYLFSSLHSVPSLTEEVLRWLQSLYVGMEERLCMLTGKINLDAYRREDETSGAATL